MWHTVRVIAFFPTRAVALVLGPLHVHWYGLLYLTAFLLGYVLVQRLQHHRNLRLSNDEWSAFLSYVVLGVIVGGRLGFALFYEPVYFMAHPLEVFAVWQGGMSSHGGFLGVSLALLLFRHRHRLPFLALTDTVIVPVAIGLALGRLGNFINQELYGIVTTLPWGTAIPGVDGLRHPTALYAVTKDLFIATVCFLHLRRAPFIPGRTTALFLVLYGMLRFALEYLREQPYGYVYSLSLGQAYTLPVIVLGIALWAFTMRRKLP